MYTLRIQAFAEIPNAALYEMLKLRFNVFVWEQQSFYAEYDDLDQEAWHISLWDGAMLVAYVRIYWGEDEKVHLGRVVVSPDLRGKKLGFRIVKEGIIASQKKWPQSVIRIGAQIHLEDFYGSLGFVRLQEIEPYDDGGIMHIIMERPSEGPITADT